MDDGIMLLYSLKKRKIHYVMDWYKMHQNCSIGANKKHKIWHRHVILSPISIT